MSFSFLHTVDSNAVLFEEALSSSGLEALSHHVREDLLQRMTVLGCIDDALEQDIEKALIASLGNADLLLLTCSSISPVADRLKAEGVNVERTDRLLAQAVFADAMANGKGRVAILVAAPTTQASTKALFEACRSQMGADAIELEIVALPGVWDLFLTGDLIGYRNALATAIDGFVSQTPASHVALGQASMAPALGQCQSPKAKRVYTVPSTTQSYLAQHHE